MAGMAERAAGGGGSWGSGWGSGSPAVDGDEGAELDRGREAWLADSGAFVLTN